MSSTAPAAERTGDRRWLALGLIAAAQFIVIMDTSIIGVALPEMQQTSASTRRTSAGSSTPTSSRSAVFCSSAAASPTCSGLAASSPPAGPSSPPVRCVAGLADSATVEIVGRAVQGAGAALIAPSALTLLFTIFGANPKELTKALALYGAAAPAGGTAGVFLGGVLTEYASWPWVFFINVPLAIAVLVMSSAVMPAGA